MRSRYYDRAVDMGADVFTSTPTPTCPPGQHWQADTTPTTVKGISACVPDVVTLTPLVLRPAAPATTATAPTTATPPTTPTATCPTPWPLWWLLVAAAAGAGAGYYVERHRKKVKRNAGRIVGRVVNRASDAALARLLG